MPTAHNVKDMTAHDGKFRFRLRDRPGGTARIVWGYILPPYPIVKIDCEHTYLWVGDPRIEQIVLEILAGGTYAERLAAHEETLFGCRAGAEGVCLWPDCPQIRDGEPEASGRTCPLDRTIAQGDLLKPA